MIEQMTDTQVAADLIQAIKKHKEALRPSQRRLQDDELYASLESARLDPVAMDQLRRWRAYYDFPDY